MKTSTLLSAIVTLGAVDASPTISEKQPIAKRASIQAVTTSGNAFYTGDKRWYMQGIDYQPGGAAANIDPLANPKVCKRDIEYFKKLGVNTIRVYAVDNKADHDECMSALADAGIYLVLDVNNPKYSINRADPHISYNADYLQSVFATVEMFAKYDNTAAFFSGNEVINDETDTDKAAPYVKAVTRDMKNYINSRGLRKIPVGYSAADVAKNRMQSAHYFNCGSDDARSDFFAFNDYSWCNSDFQESGWDIKVRNFTDYGLPIFLSEWGCIETRPRKFEEIGALMSEKMTGVYSGGLMYEYSLEENDFGIVEIKNGNIEELDEFAVFQQAIKDNPAPDNDGGASSESHSSECPESDDDWPVDPDFIPSMPEEAETYMKKGAGEGPGLDGSGSQQAGDSGTSTASASGGQPSPTSDSSGDDDSAGIALQGSVVLMLTGLAVSFGIGGSLLL